MENKESLEKRVSDLENRLSLVEKADVRNLSMVQEIVSCEQQIKTYEADIKEINTQIAKFNPTLQKLKEQMDEAEKKTEHDVSDTFGTEPKYKAQAEFTEAKERYDSGMAKLLELSSTEGNRKATIERLKGKIQTLRYRLEGKDIEELIEKSRYIRG